MSFVVNIAKGSYPEVSEWGTPEFTGFDWVWYQIHHPKEGYTKRGWTWSEKNNKFLQKEYGGEARAYLLHINGGFFTATLPGATY